MSESIQVTPALPRPPATPQASRPWARIRRRSARFWLEFMFWWTEHFPWMVLWTRPLFLWHAWHFAAAVRGALLANARRLLPPGATEKQIAALALDTLRKFYMNVYQLGIVLRQPVESLPSRVESITGDDHYQAARRMRRGAVLVTAHLGPVEQGIAALTGRERHIHVVFQHDASPRFERLRSRLRHMLGVSEHPVDDGWPIWVRLRDALQRNEVVMIQGDRTMPGQRGRRVPFLNGHILLPTGPVRLALAAGAPLIPVFSIGLPDGRLRIVIDAPLSVSPEEPERALLGFAAALARQVTAHPEQWSMLHKVWCEDVDGD